MTSALTPLQRQQLHDSLLSSRLALEAQRSAHLAGQSRAGHAREVLLQDGDDATQRDAEPGADRSERSGQPATL